MSLSKAIIAYLRNAIKSNAADREWLEQRETYHLREGGDGFGRALTTLRSKRRNRAHLNQKLLLHQAVDHEQRVGRIGAASGWFRHCTGLVEARDGRRW